MDTTTLQVLQTVWFFLIGFLLLGYSVLDGFDLGIGTLLPFIAKNKKETATLLTSIGPVWDGNEVWIITAGGALFAAFPHVYATVFSGFYLALMLLLFALIFRAVSQEFWSMDEARRGLWKWTFSLGSFLAALLFGVALGNVIAGVPLSEKMEFTGNFFTLLRPYPVVLGLLGFSAILLQGSTYAILKIKEGPLQDKFRTAGKWIWAALVFFWALSLILTAVYLPEGMKNPLAWICTAALVVFLVLNRIWMDRKNDSLPFITSTLSLVSLWSIAGSLQFPKLVRALPGSAAHLTIYNSSSTELTLTAMLVIALIGMPIVIGYTIYAYRIFRGKVNL